MNEWDFSSGTDCDSCTPQCPPMSSHHGKKQPQQPQTEYQLDPINRQPWHLLRPNPVSLYSNYLCCLIPSTLHLLFLYTCWFPLLSHPHTPQLLAMTFEVFKDLSTMQFRSSCKSTLSTWPTQLSLTLVCRTLLPLGCSVKSQTPNPETLGVALHGAFPSC